MIEAIEVAARLVGARRTAMSGAPVIRPATTGRHRPFARAAGAAMRSLGAGYYTPAQVEAAVRYVCVPDRELIEDGTYLVAELDGRLVGCGGWSLRRKAYAGPAESETDAERLDPLIEPTRIRAMFTAPDVARQGVGRAILGPRKTPPAPRASAVRGSARRSAARTSTAVRAMSRSAGRRRPCPTARRSR